MTKFIQKFPIKRKPSEAWIFGVCAGIASHFGWSTAIVRILFVAVLWASFGLGLLAYLALAFVMPTEDDLESLGARSRHRQRMNAARN